MPEQELTEAAELIRQAGVKIAEAASRMDGPQKAELGTMNNKLNEVTLILGLLYSGTHFSTPSPRQSNKAAVNGLAG